MRESQLREGAGEPCEELTMSCLHHAISCDTGTRKSTRVAHVMCLCCYVMDYSLLAPSVALGPSCETVKL